MPVPDYQSLMRPVLEHAAKGEVKIGDVVAWLSEALVLSPDERTELLPSGKQTIVANRVHWAKSYLKQAELVETTRRGYFKITERGRKALSDPSLKIDNAFLRQFPEFIAFQRRINEREEVPQDTDLIEFSITPDEALRAAHKNINDALAAELLDRVRKGTPAFFENVLVSLFVRMGYGGSSEQAGRALGKAGDDGIDGVIDQDPLGVDQIYLQAKRYAEGNNVGSGAIRDFFGGLSLKRASKGIFVTTSAFSQSAYETAKGLGSRIVLIDGIELSRLMIRYNIGCRDEDVLHLKRVDEDFFETSG